VGTALPMATPLSPMLSTEKASASLLSTQVSLLEARKQELDVRLNLAQATLRTSRHSVSPVRFSPDDGTVPANWARTAVSRSPASAGKSPQFMDRTEARLGALQLELESVTKSEQDWKAKGLTALAELEKAKQNQEDSREVFDLLKEENAMIKEGNRTQRVEEPPPCMQAGDLPVEAERHLLDEAHPNPNPVACFTTPEIDES